MPISRLGVYMSRTHLLAALRSVWAAYFFVACPMAHACKPPSGATPPSVKALLESSAYVVYAEVLAFEQTPGGRRAKVKVLEQFKGPPLESIGAPGHSCSPRLFAGKANVYFLDHAGNGHALRYPYNLRTKEILAELRELKPEAANPR